MCSGGTEKRERTKWKLNVLAVTVMDPSGNAGGISSNRVEDTLARDTVIRNESVIL